MSQHFSELHTGTDDHSHAHPSEGTYIRVAIVLAIITTIEVVIYYIDWFHTSGLLVPALVVMSIVKFAAVVSYFMHLKVDDERYRIIFLAGLILAIAIVAALVVLMRTHKIDYALRMITG